MTKKLMAIFAHPDDEAFGTGGTFAKYAAQGAEIHLVTATLGEAGRVALPDYELTDPLCVVRDQELRNACDAYGVTHLHLLGYMDGQTAVVPPSVAVHQIVRLIRQHQPQVVITFGPDGVYGHFDHLVVHRWATAAVTMAGQAEKWPGAGEPHHVAKLYYRALPNRYIDWQIDLVGSAHVLMDGVPFPFVGYPDEYLTTIVNIKAQLETKLRGIKCHATQFTERMPFLRPDFDPTTQPFFYQETYHLAQCHIPDYQPTDVEDDLFAGIS